MTPSASAAPTVEEQYRASFPTSRALHERAAAIFPSGINHDLRFLQPFPLYVERAKGSHKWDVDGHELIDYWVGHGALLLGHLRDEVEEAVVAQARRGTHYGACHALEIEWAELVQRLLPSAQSVRFVSSGTEAIVMALRLARTFTGKSKVLKFLGHFHGWYDNVIPGADPPFEALHPAGVLDGVMDSLVFCPPNDVAAVDQRLRQDKDIACVILEPTGGHFGGVPIRGEFLHQLRELTAKHGVLLLFDEVITGFRCAPGGAQGYYGVTPDLTTLAKVLAGGLPGGAVAGRRDVLSLLGFDADPKKKMKHPGTFNANPLSAAAGIATLRIVATGAPCDRANAVGAALRRGFRDVALREGVPWAVYGDFSAFHILPDYAERLLEPDEDDFVPYGGNLHKLDVKISPKLHCAFRCAMLLNGVDVLGLRGMTCAAHTDEDADRTVEAFREAVRRLKREGLIG